MANSRLNLFVAGNVFFVFGLSYFLSDKTIISYLGISFILFLLLALGSKTYHGVYTCWIGPYLGHHVNPKSLGRWAVITGATDGIGLEYSRQLAALGMNICLISRSQEKLDKTALQLEDEYQVKTKTVAVDFSLPPDTYFEKLRHELEKVDDIGLLVNNVGICPQSPEPFGSPALTMEITMSLINVNLYAALALTKIVLPGMVEKNKGAVINIGSISCFIGLPYFSVYSSTKSFLDRFTLDLGVEYAHTNILFQYQYPSYVTSKMNGFKDSNIFLPNANSYVKKAIRSIGLESHSPIWPWHRIVVPIVSIYKFLMPGLVRNVAVVYTKNFWGMYWRKQMKKQIKIVHENFEKVDLKNKKLMETL